MRKLTFCKAVDNMPVRAKVSAAPQPHDRMALRPTHPRDKKGHISPHINKTKAYTRLIRGNRR